MPIFLGLLLGTALAVADGLILRAVARKAAEQKQEAQKLLVRGFAARYLLTFAVLAFALFVPVFDAVCVILPMILQKVLLVILSVRAAGKK